MNIMRKNITISIGTIIVAIVFVLNTGAFAGRGCGYGNYGYRDNPDVKRERAAFLNETKELRERLFNKEQLLGVEMGKESPDVDIAKKIQKELSALRAELDQQWIAYAIKMKKHNPNFGSGYGHMARGSGSGGGYCW